MIRHNSIRLMAPLAISVVIGAMPIAASALQNPQYMRGYSLTGRSFSDFRARGEDHCRRTCATNPNCRGWTFSRRSAGAAYEDPGKSDGYNRWMQRQINEDLYQRCFLYSDPGHPSYNGAAVSGIKPPPPAVAGQRPDPPVVRRD
jgi:hypothetical protein